MTEKTISAANQAIFELQLNTPDAVRYVISHAQVDSKEASRALKAVMTGYKSK